MGGRICGFPPIATPKARVLVLGSMPGVASLDAVEYYAHPRNSFWSIVSELLDGDPGADYPTRVALLQHHGVALWDVLASCERPGSLDSAIDDTSLKVNDFEGFFAVHPHLHTVLFNGARAERDYRRRVLVQVSDFRFDYRRLPSTSPALASLNRAQKLLQWRYLVEALAR